MIKIASRESQLALWQADWVKQQIISKFPEESVEIVTFKTKGDKILDKSLSKIGGKGLFVKELEQALIEGKADLAVHSMKDVPFEMPEELEIKVVSARENPYDAFVSNNFESFQSLPQNAVLGTSSLRRAIQAKRLKEDLVVKPLRGNVNTRLRKLDDGEFDAIILACAGLIRLNMKERIRDELSPDQFIPAVAQGVLGIQTRKSDGLVLEKIDHIYDESSFLTTTAERSFLKALEGNCSTPIGGYAILNDGQIQLTGFTASEDGSSFSKGEISGTADQADALGFKLKELLFK